MTPNQPSDERESRRFSVEIAIETEAATPADAALHLMRWVTRDAHEIVVRVHSGNQTHDVLLARNDEWNQWRPAVARRHKL